MHIGKTFSIRTELSISEGNPKCAARIIPLYDIPGTDYLAGATLNAVLESKDEFVCLQLVTSSWTTRHTGFWITALTAISVHFDVRILVEIVDE